MYTTDRNLPTTIAQALDALSDDILRLFETSPRPTHGTVADQLLRRFAVRVSPDNLRIWLHRRHADAYRQTVAPLVRCRLDDYFEVVESLRGDGYSWRQVVECLTQMSPELAATPEGLRSWYCRRTKRGAKLLSAAEKASAGVASARSGTRVRNASDEPEPEPRAARLETTAVDRDGASPDLKAAAAQELARLTRDNPMHSALLAAGVAAG